MGGRRRGIVGDDLTMVFRPGFSSRLYIVLKNLTDGRLNHARQNKDELGQNSRGSHANEERKPQIEIYK